MTIDLNVRRTLTLTLNFAPILCTVVATEYSHGDPSVGIQPGVEDWDIFDGTDPNDWCKFSEAQKTSLSERDQDHIQRELDEEYEKVVRKRSDGILSMALFLQTEPMVQGPPENMVYHLNRIGDFNYTRFDWNVCSHYVWADVFYMGHSTTRGLETKAWRLGEVRRDHATAEWRFLAGDDRQEMCQGETPGVAFLNAARLLRNEFAVCFGIYANSSTTGGAL